MSKSFPSRISEVTDPLILFDEVCKLCAGSVQFVIKRDKRKRFHYAPLQSPLAGRLLGTRRGTQDSVVLIEDGRAYYKSTAALRIAKHLDGLWPMFSALLAFPQPLRDAVYDLIGSCRYRLFGKRQTCWTPAGETADRFLDSGTRRTCGD